MKKFLQLLTCCCFVAGMGTGCVYVEEHGGDWDDDWRGGGSCLDEHGLSCDPVSDAGCGAGCAVCDDGTCLEFADGKDACSSDSDCFGGEACLGGECLWCPDECEDNGDCDSGWRCSSADVCIPAYCCLGDADCRNNRVCAPNGYCSAPLGEPSDDGEDDDANNGDGSNDGGGDDDSNGGHDVDDCPDDECVTPYCDSDRECRSGSQCVAGECIAQCTADAECSAGHVCSAGLCSPDPDGGDQCLYNAECDNGVCENGYCIDRCSADADCAVGDFCDAGSCRPDTRPTEPECRVNADCADGEVCSDAQCRLSCTCDEDCGAEGVLVCDAGACVETGLLTRNFEKPGREEYMVTARMKGTTVAEQELADQQDEEASWIEAALAGDMPAFRRLYDCHFDFVARQVGRIMGPGADAEDVVQEVFVAVYRSLGNFRGDSQFSTWLYRLTYNVTVSHLRKRPKTVELSAWRPLREPHSAWARLEARDMVRVLYAALDNVSLEHREAFLLHEVEGLKLREISELTGELIDTIAARVRRTRERLQEVLEAAGGEA